MAGRLSTTPHSGYFRSCRPGPLTLIRVANLAMAIRDVMRKCVVFVSSENTRGETDVRGTAFLVMHPIDGTSNLAGYVVTARHVVERAAERTGSFFLRVNTIDKKTRLLPTKLQDWEFHDDPRVDVAATSADWAGSASGREFDHLFVPTEAIVTDDAIEQLAITAGDELFFPGLFTKRPGEEYNIPIVRSGTLAAVERELVDTAHGPMRGYLAEVRSIGGHSGSPVFMHLDCVEKQLVLDNHTPRYAEIPEGSMLHRIPLLGLVHGHTDRHQANEGIAVIVPATELLRVLSRPRFAAEREKYRDEIIASRGTTTPD